MIYLLYLDFSQTFTRDREKEVYFQAITLILKVKPMKKERC